MVRVAIRIRLVMTMLNLAINLFLFIAILFMVAIVFGFFWVIVGAIFTVKEIKKEYKIIKGIDNHGKD